MTGPARIPAAVWSYMLRWHPGCATGYTEHHPTVSQTYSPGSGWTRYPYRKRVSQSWARKARRGGVTHAAILFADGRAADFSITELAR